MKKQKPDPVKVLVITWGVMFVVFIAVVAVYR